MAVLLSWFAENKSLCPFCQVRYWNCIPPSLVSIVTHAEPPRPLLRVPANSNSVQIPVKRRMYSSGFSTKSSPWLLATIKKTMRYTLLLLSIFAIQPLSAQTTLRDWNEHRFQRTERSMWVLGGWAAANVLVGAVGMGRTSGERRAFHQMNLGWGVVNLGLAASGLWTATHGDPAALDGWASYEALQRTRHIFVFNAGLDVGYVMAGFWAQERSKNVVKRAERMRGFGKSLVLQGAFLFAFDLGAYFYHQPLAEQFRQHMPLENWSIGMRQDGVGLTWAF